MRYDNRHVEQEGDSLPAPWPKKHKTAMSDAEKDRWLLAGKIMIAAGGAILAFFGVKK